MVPGVGGGICQVSSTLYNAALYANLEITQRRNHSYTVAYVKNGLDATVSYGSIDFKFKNKDIGTTVDVSVEISLSDIGLTETDLDNAVIYIADLQYFNYNTTGYTHVDPFTISVGGTTVCTWANGSKNYQFTFTTEIVNGKLSIKATTDYKPVLSGAYSVRFTIDCIVYVSD